MRAAIYVRVSTEKQVDGTSLDNQEQLCRKRAGELGYVENNIDIFREEGSSGEDIDVRPKMANLRKLASENTYTHIICYHPDRFARDMTDKLIVCREFEKNNTQLVFSDQDYNDSPEGKLFFNIMSSIAEYEHSLIKRRTISGRVSRVRNNKEVMAMRVAPFGYEWNKKQLTVNEEESKYVKMVYKWYVYDKFTLRQIGEKLYNYGVKPKRKESNYWSATSIRRILTSEIYIGKYYYNRRKTKKIRGEMTKGGNPKKSYVYRDEKDWLLVEVPSIVDEEMWNLAQKQRKKNKTVSGNIKYNYLLKSLLICKNCGRRWNGTYYAGGIDKETGEKKKYLTYRCPNKNPKKYGNKDSYCNCKNNSIRADLLEDFIWNEVISDVIKNPKELNEKMLENKENQDDELETNLASLQSNIKNKEEEKSRIKKMFQFAVIEEDEMLKDMKVVNDDIADIKYDVSLLQSKQKAKISTGHKRDMLLNFSKEYIDEIQSENELSFEFKRNAITSFIDEIVIDIDENNEVDIDIKGVIQGLIKEESNIGSSTQLLNDMNTMQCVEMLIKSRFSLEKSLTETTRRLTYIIDKASINNEYVLK